MKLMKLRKLQGKIMGMGVLGLLACSSYVAQAQAITIGVVDEDKLGEGYTKYINAMKDINQRAQTLDKQLEARSLLTEVEGKRFDALIAKETRTAAEEAELQNLVKSGSERRAEFMKLNGQSKRTDAENARVKALLADAQRNAPALQKISDDLFNRIRKQEDQTSKEYTDQANKVIEAVAKEKNLTLVMRKRALIWNADSIDITKEVLDRLNKT